MEIKVGEYVKFDNGEIFKADEDGIDYYNYILQANPRIKVECEPNIVEHSSNIIDLIEVGDYVNGKQINSIQLAKLDNGEIIKRLICQLNIYDSPIIYEDKDIKSIVTKEQFTSIEYKI